MARRERVRRRRRKMSKETLTFADIRRLEVMLLMFTLFPELIKVPFMTQTVTQRA